MNGLRCTIVSVLMILGVAACQSDSAGPEQPEGTLLVLLEGGADLQQGDGDFVAAKDGAYLDEGDTIRTDADGFVELHFPDGSLTRLDSDTTVVLERIENAPDSRAIGLRLESGRTWEEVEESTSHADSFEVETPVGTARVRGTNFTVECTHELTCLFTVLQGWVDIDTADGTTVQLKAGERLVVGADGVPKDISFLEGDDLFNERWIGRNTVLAGEGVDGPTEPPPGGAIATARLAGDWVFVFKPKGIKNLIGTPARLYVSFKGECGDGPCDLKQTGLPDVGVARFDGAGYSASALHWGLCGDPPNGPGPTIDGPAVLRWTVTDAGVENGEMVATAIDGSFSFKGTNNARGNAQGCAGDSEWHGLLKGRPR